MIPPSQSKTDLPPIEIAALLKASALALQPFPPADVGQRHGRL